MMDAKKVDVLVKIERRCPRCGVHRYHLCNVAKKQARCAECSHRWKCRILERDGTGMNLSAISSQLDEQKEEAINELVLAAKEYLALGFVNTHTLNACQLSSAAYKQLRLKEALSRIGAPA